MNRGEEHRYPFPYASGVCRVCSDAASRPAARVMGDAASAPSTDLAELAVCKDGDDHKIAANGFDVPPYYLLAGYLAALNL